MNKPMIWNVLFVDDEEDTCKQVREYLEDEKSSGGEELRVTTETDFDRSIEIMEMGRFDLVILDVRVGPQEVEDGDDVGIYILEEIKRTRFIPVVFYTALPHCVRHLQEPLVHVIEKTEGLGALLNSINKVFDTGLPLVNRALVRHMEEVQREYMWEFVVRNWNFFRDAPDRGSLAYLLARRLAMSLTDSGIREFAERLGGKLGIGGEPSEAVPPMRYYIKPPVETSPLTGDLYYGTIDNMEAYWLLLNPSCDMVQGRVKTDCVAFCKCVRLEDQPEYHEWREGLPQSKKEVLKNLSDLLTNNRREGQRDRYYCLPAALELPNLIVDFQQLVPLNFEKLKDLERKASLDSPFAEEIVSRFVRYFGRIGSPDLDVEIVLQRLRSELNDGQKDP